MFERDSNELGRPPSLRNGARRKPRETKSTGMAAGAAADAALRGIPRAFVAREAAALRKTERHRRGASDDHVASLYAIAIRTSFWLELSLPAGAGPAAADALRARCARDPDLPRRLDCLRATHPSLLCARADAALSAVYDDDALAEMLTHAPVVVDHAVGASGSDRRKESAGRPAAAKAIVPSPVVAPELSNGVEPSGVDAQHAGDGHRQWRRPQLPSKLPAKLSSKLAAMEEAAGGAAQAAARRLAAARAAAASSRGPIVPAGPMGALNRVLESRRRTPSPAPSPAPPTPPPATPPTPPSLPTAAAPPHEQRAEASSATGCVTAQGIAMPPTQAPSAPSPLAALGERDVGAVLDEQLRRGRLGVHARVQEQRAAVGQRLVDVGLGVEE